jgi:hypothetical protein
MKQTFASLLVASAVAVTAAGLGAVGLDTRQGGQAQQSQSSQGQSSQPGAQGRDEAAARQELVQAKQTLMDLTKLPETQQLQGEARNGVIQIINSFNSLVTADANWYDRYQEVQQQLSRILGDSAASGTATSGTESGSVGTSGSSSADMPAAVRSKLVEFRQHLEAFGKAAGAPANAAAAGSSSTAGSASAASAQSATGTTTSQSTAASTQEPSSVTSAAGETFQQHFDAIADLVQQALGSAPAPSGSTTTGTTGSSTTGSSTTGSSTTASQAGATSPAATVTVDRAALEQIQSHLQRLRQLARQRGIQ